MKNLHTKLGYLKGLAEGLGVTGDTKEGKVIQQVIVLLDEMVASIENLQEDCDELYTHLEALDEDLTDLEDNFFKTDDEQDEADRPHYDDSFEEYDDDGHDISFSVECPECRHEVAIDEDILGDEESLEVLCPNCGRVVFINDEEWEDDLNDLEKEEEEE